MEGRRWKVEGEKGRSRASSGSALAIEHSEDSGNSDSGSNSGSDSGSDSDRGRENYVKMMFEDEARKLFVYKVSSLIHFIFFRFVHFLMVNIAGESECKVTDCKVTVRWQPATVQLTPALVSR